MPLNEEYIMNTFSKLGKKVATLGAIGVFFIMALEVVIMISPFAFFFYSVFNPIFHFLGQFSATRWTTSFFLPHMILPPTLFLQSLRVLGSVLFVTGFLLFTVCALQVYLGKIFKWGIADKGLYRYVRHPQYLALGIWGTGMAILWPRFIVLVTLSLMFILYYFLARDEERRMTNQYGASYEDYKSQRGMFLPLAIEKPVSGLFKRLAPSPALQNLVIPLLILVVVLGTGFGLRAVTVHSLPLAAQGNLTVVPILPEDATQGDKILQGVLKAEAAGALPFLEPGKSYLGYVMPPDYIMQGMIADTGDRSHLFKHHHTVTLIVDWVIHPFEHLRRPPAAHMAAMHHMDPAMVRRHHCPLQLSQAQLACDTCPYRRVIWVEVNRGQTRSLAGEEDLSLGVKRHPVGFLDINTQDGELVTAKPVQPGTAWKDVPTPEI
jgi:protein-S-isoprenylcysteine O-methyltransferase Ste14